MGRRPDYASRSASPRSSAAWSLAKVPPSLLPLAEAEPSARQPVVHGGGQTACVVISCAGAVQAPGDDGLVSGVEQFDLADDRAVPAKMPPVQAVAQEDADVSAAFGAERLGFAAGVR